MQLSWEAVSALASLLAAIALLAAAGVGLRQLWVARTEVEQLRKATQLEGTLRILEQLSSEEQIEARHFIEAELKERIDDPHFREELRSLNPSAKGHPELRVLHLLETIGTFIRYGLLDEELVFEQWCLTIVSVWEHLDGHDPNGTGVIAIHREMLGKAAWENFEDLYKRASAWCARYR